LFIFISFFFFFLFSLTKLDLASFNEVNKTARRRGDKIYAPLNLPAQKEKKRKIKNERGSPSCYSAPLPVGLMPRKWL
jgi:hypothetical protein